jgi:hypothetical protein
MPSAVFNQIRNTNGCVHKLLYWGGGGERRPEAEFWDEIQTKVLRAFIHAIHSHLYSFASDLYFFKLTQPLSVSTVQMVLYTVKEKGGKPDRKPYPLLFGLRNQYRLCPEI